jgi:hypothetical protein
VANRDWALVTVGRPGVLQYAPTGLDDNEAVLLRKMKRPAHHEPDSFILLGWGCYFAVLIVSMWVHEPEMLPG